VRRASANIAEFPAAAGQGADRQRFVRVAGGTGTARRTFLMVSVPADAAAGSGSRLRGMLDVTQDEQVLGRYLRKLAAVVALAIVLAALERSFDQLSRFSSDLAHEFRSPINNLVAAASVTLGRAREAGEYQGTVEVVVEEGNRLSRMVSSMLFLTRADNATQWVRVEPVSIESEFRKLVDFFEIAAEEQGVVLSAEGACSLMADPLLLRRALSNLLTNALRYTPRGGMIALQALDEGDVVVLSVRDNGAGIGPAHLPFLFDRFYRADAARSAADSSGLGLAVVRSIAELHGGSVNVSSVEGLGSCFEMRLPKR
jgi:two-component system heavy metal sensor histidine kinase CusS